MSLDEHLKVQEGLVIDRLDCLNHNSSDSHGKHRTITDETIEPTSSEPLVHHQDDQAGRTSADSGPKSSPFEPTAAGRSLEPTLQPRIDQYLDDWTSSSESGGERDDVDGNENDVPQYCDWRSKSGWIGLDHPRADLMLLFLGGRIYSDWEGD